jgi:hypothetical protein
MVDGAGDGGVDFSAERLQLGLEVEIRNRIGHDYSARRYRLKFKM